MGCRALHTLVHYNKEIGGERQCTCSSRVKSGIKVMEG